MKTMHELSKDLWRWMKRPGRDGWGWRRYIYLFLFLMSGLFIAYILITNWWELRQRTSEVNILLVLIPIVCYPLGMLPTALSWHLVLKAIGVEKSVWLNLRAYAITTLPRKIPGSIWFLSSRAALYREVGIPASITISATIIEGLLLSLTGFCLSLLLAGRFFIRLISDNPGLAIVIPGFVIVFLLILLLFSNLGVELRRLIGKKFRLSFPQFQINKILGVASTMIVAWIGGGSLLYITTQAVETIPFKVIFNIIGIWALSGSISLVISFGVSAFGIREITLAALLGVLISPVSSIIVVIAFRIILTAGELIWALIFITIANRKI